MPQPQKIRVGLVGAGYVSAHHLRALQALDFVEVVGIADVNFELAQQVARRFGVSAAFRSLAEMKPAKPDVIHVLTPPALHASIAIEALEMGCHVFVEKPMAETAEDCDRMIAAARRANRRLTVNHSARMDPVVLQAVDLVRSGVCGDVLGVDFFRSSDYAPYSGGPSVPVPYRKGSYPFQDLGIHGYSIFEAFLGPILSTEVRHRSSGRDLNLVFDEWRATAQCERGVGQMYLSWNVRPIRNEIFVHGTHGIIHVDCFLQTCSMVRSLPGPKFASAVVGAVMTSAKNLWRVPMNVLRFATGKLSGAPGIHVSIRKFYEALQSGAEAPISAEEGRRLIACMEQGSRAADEEKQALRVKALRPLSPMSTLVTGAGGFLGRALVNRLLQRGESVRVLVRRPVAQWQDNPRVQMVCGDLGDPDVIEVAVKGIETVYHVGAAMKGGPADFERGTIWGTRNVIDSCLRHGVKRVVYVSSLSVLDHAGHKKGQPVGEDAPYEPHANWRGAYTQTKLEAERMVLAAVRERNLPAVVLRPGQIFGPGAEGVAPSGVIGLAGRWIVVGSGRLALPLVYVEDVVDSLVAAAERPNVLGRIFNVVDAEKITQKEYIAACRRVPGSRVRDMYVPGSLLYFAGVACEVLAKVLGRGLPLSRYRVRSIRPLAPFDVSAAREGLGWTPQVGSREGMRRTFAPAEQQSAGAMAKVASAAR